MERVTPPTVRQIYGLARALCAEQEIEFPETREEASKLLSRYGRHLKSPPKDHVSAKTEEFRELARRR